ncbi:helix-turn-helix transcriptional regulator [Rhodanobacter sp. BL-MT-08]
MTATVFEEMGLMRRAALLKLLKISNSTLYRRMDPDESGFDPDFPTPIELGPQSNPGSIVAWIESEVGIYVAARIARRDAAIKGRLEERNAAIRTRFAARSRKRHEQRPKLQRESTSELTSLVGRSAAGA